MRYRQDPLSRDRDAGLSGSTAETIFAGSSRNGRELSIVRHWWKCIKMTAPPELTKRAGIARVPRVSVCNERNNALILGITAIRIELRITYTQKKD